jgi:microfibrillar-associated protein 1
MVIDEILREAESKKTNDSDTEMPDDNDEIDEEIELTAWKLRELKRLKRDRLERETAEFEAKELERRRGLTDEQLRAEDEAKGRYAEKDKGTMKFLQRYYHKGSFFTTGDNVDEIYQRDFTQATGMDRTVDREALPSIMQVKKFGMRGRTKYTHLADQDTTKQEKPVWGKEYQKHQLAGTGQINPGKKDTSQYDRDRDRHRDRHREHDRERDRERRR